MTDSYLNRFGIRYYLPEFGPAVRWMSCAMLSPNRSDLPVLYYFECDAENQGSRAIHIFEDGRTLLAYPGGPDGDHLPEVALPQPGEDDLADVETREISRQEFNALWCALSRIDEMSAKADMQVRER